MISTQKKTFRSLSALLPLKAGWPSLLENIFPKWQVLTWVCLFLVAGLMLKELRDIHSNTRVWKRRVDHVCLWKSEPNKKTLKSTSKMMANQSRHHPKVLEILPDFSGSHRVIFTSLLMEQIQHQWKYIRPCLIKDMFRVSTFCTNASQETVKMIEILSRDLFPPVSHANYRSSWRLLTHNTPLLRENMMSKAFYIAL